MMPQILKRLEQSIGLVALGAVLISANGCSAESAAPSRPAASVAQLPPVVDQRGALGLRFVGDYALVTVDGQPLPYVFIDLPNPLNLKQEAIGGDLTMASDGSFIFVSHFRDTQNGVVRLYSDTVVGTFVTAGFGISFTETSGYGFVGSLHANTIEFDYRGGILAFDRMLVRSP